MSWQPALWHIVAALPFGLLLGTALGPFRVSGVDFRQWFKDPAQPNVLDDETWIGLVSDATSFLTRTLWAGLFLGAVLFWLPTRFDWTVVQDGVLRFAGTYLLFWFRWPMALGIVGGIVIMQFVIALIWQLGLRRVPDVTEIRPLSTVAAPRQPELEPRRRRIVICCDGTWNWPDAQRETNVIRLVRAIEPVTTEATPQIVYYHQGVGTGNIVDRIVGGGAGVGLANSVKACYGFLADNYNEGDQISLFGFSRGAYVARSTAGVIGTVGILRKDEMEHFAEIWDWYTDPRRPRDLTRLNQLAPTRHQAVDIQCIGVWDTVGALGIPGTRFCAKTYAFHDTQLGPGVRHAFQALAIDERRGNFQPAVWVPNASARNGQVLEQTWFPGVHSNIGGGYQAHGLSDSAFLWMAALIEKWGVLELNEESIRLGLDQSDSERYPRGLLQNSRTIGWRLLGSPIPRPVGITSDRETIHSSAWDRAAALPASGTHRDPYQRSSRQRWLGEMTALRQELSEFEVKFRETTSLTLKHLPPRQVGYRRLRFCDRLMQYVGGSG